LKSQLRDKVAPPLASDDLKFFADPPIRERARACHKIEMLLEQSWLSAKDREKLWKTGRQLAAALNAETLARDAAEDQRHLQTEMPAGASPAPDQEREIAVARAALAIELLRLESTVDTRDLERLRKDAENQALDGNAWDELRRALRDKWARVRKEQSKQDRE
jgi:hypothetical protein